MPPAWPLSLSVLFARAAPSASRRQSTRRRWASLISLLRNSTKFGQLFEQIRATNSQASDRPRPPAATRRPERAAPFTAISSSLRANNCDSRGAWTSVRGGAGNERRRRRVVPPRIKAMPVRIPIATTATASVPHGSDAGRSEDQFGATAASAPPETCPTPALGPGTDSGEETALHRTASGAGTARCGKRRRRQALRRK
jgi:hypothetical protein